MPNVAHHVGSTDSIEWMGGEGLHGWRQGAAGELEKVLTEDVFKRGGERAPNEERGARLTNGLLIAAVGRARPVAEGADRRGALAVFILLAIAA